MEVKALACELPARRGVPLSRFSHADIAREVIEEGIVASISKTTVWRWLSADAIKPWSHRNWIYPRDPRFREKGERVLDLYHRQWEGKPLQDDDYVLCADEKTSIQARARVHAGQGPHPGRLRRIEFEYERRGALAYLAAWDVHRAKVFGRSERTTGIAAHRRLVDQVMEQEPYKSAHRVFWITDNGSSHRGATSVKRLAAWYPNAVQVHTPVHASWLNQIEIYFSVVQRKLLTPNEFSDLTTLEQQLQSFEAYYEQSAKPFEWKFTREDLHRLMDRLEQAHYIEPKEVA
jgi:hypothetical protein